MESEIIGAIIAIIVSVVATVGVWQKFKRRFSEIVDLLMTLDSAWKDDKITEDEWNAIWEKLMRFISNASKKDVSE